MEPVMNTHLQVPEGRIPLRNKILALVAIAGTVMGFGFNQTRQIVYPVLREAIRVSALIETRNWPQLESEHFAVRYAPNNGDAEMAQIVLENAEAVYQPVVSAYGYQASKKILVVVYPSKVQMGHAFGWDADESAMGVYWGGVIRVLSPEQWIPEHSQDKLKAVFADSGPMAHELVHLIVDYQTGGNYTRWLTEGIAQYREWQVTGFEFDEPNSDTNQVLYPLAKMDGNFDYLPNQALAYRQSFLAVEYLIQHYGEAKLNNLLTELGRGRTMDQAFTKIYGINLKTYEQELTRWIEQQPSRQG